MLIGLHATVEVASRARTRRARRVIGERMVISFGYWENSAKKARVSRTRVKQDLFDLAF